MRLMSNTRCKLLTVLPLGSLLLAGCAAKQTPPGEARPAAAAADPMTPTDPATTAKLKEVLAAPHRSEKNRARDIYRHPLETLSFFGLRDDMTVVELWPGGGWYTEILAPVLKDRGKLVVTGGDPATSKGAKEFRDRFGAKPELFGKIDYVVWSPPAKSELGPAGSADLVLTFRSVHGWIGGKSVDTVFKAVYDVLKPGGVFGVVEHRARPGMDVKTGYVEEEAVIRIAAAAGFKLDERSEINANPKDTKDHPEGVWTLPPTLRLGDKDRDKYVAIGESDRMTLRFVKPGR